MLAEKKAARLEAYERDTKALNRRRRWGYQEPRSDIPSTMPALAAACAVWGPPWTPIDLGFRESR